MMTKDEVRQKVRAAMADSCAMALEELERQLASDSLQISCHACEEPASALACFVLIKWQCVQHPIDPQIEPKPAIELQ